MKNEFMYIIAHIEFAKKNLVNKFSVASYNCYFKNDGLD